LHFKAIHEAYEAQHKNDLFYRVNLFEKLHGELSQSRRNFLGWMSQLCFLREFYFFNEIYFKILESYFFSLLIFTQFMIAFGFFMNIIFILLQVFSDYLKLIKTVVF